MLALGRVGAIHLPEMGQEDSCIESHMQQGTAHQVGGGAGPTRVSVKHVGPLQALAQLAHMKLRCILSTLTAVD